MNKERHNNLSKKIVFWVILYVYYLSIQSLGNFSNYTPDKTHISASELAFENGNRKFLISEILNISDKKHLIFDGVLAK